MTIDALKGRIPTGLPKIGAGDAAATPDGAGFSDALGRVVARRSSRPRARPTPR